MNTTRKNSIQHIKPIVIIMLALLASVAVFSSGRAAAGPPSPPPGYAQHTPTPQTDQIMVTFASETSRSAAARETLLDRMSAAAGMSLSFVRPMSGGAYVYRLPAPLANDQVAAISRDLAALPEIAHAEPDIILRHTGIAVPHAADKAPNDPDYGDQWHYRYAPGSEEGINLEPAWAITTGSSNTVVAVLDTGILPHADLGGRTVPGYDFISSSIAGNDGNGRDNNPADPGDWNDAGQCGSGSPANPSSWHGTHVAGTIGAASNNGDDVAGVNWQAKILPVRVLGRCGGSTSDVIDAIRWSAGLAVSGVPANANPARVLNMSLGGPGACSPLMQAAFDDIIAAGAVAVVAAGNSYDLVDFYNPASCNGVITVAATDRHGDPAWYTNYGSAVEVSAPGGDTYFVSADGILSTLNSGTAGPGADSLAFYQGTSMAAPHVAGVASLLLGMAPSLTPAQVSDLIIDTVRDFPEDSYCSPAYCGDGIVDAYNALSALDPLPAPELIYPDNGATITDPLPGFEWAAVNGATGYGLVIAEDDTFATGVLDTLVNDTSFEPAAPLADGTYYWRVNAQAGSDFSPWSDVWSFTVDTSDVECSAPDIPALLTPADGVTLFDPAPVFSWEEADRANSYFIYIDDAADLNSPLITETTFDLSYQPPALAPGQYYWAVGGSTYSDEGSCDIPGPLSEIRTFTIDSDEGCVLPGTPELLEPADGATTGPTPTLSWDETPDATSYRVYIDQDPALGSPDIGDTMSRSYTPDPLSPGVYYWAVVAWNDEEWGCDFPGGRSEIWRFTVEEKGEYLLYLPSLSR